MKHFIVFVLALILSACASSKKASTLEKTESSVDSVVVSENLVKNTFFDIDTSKVKEWGFTITEIEYFPPDSDANAMQMQCKSTVKESKEKESKEESLSNDKEKESKKRKAFLPPSLEEVQAYINEKGYSIDAEAFIAFYSSKNWYVGSNKMTNWRMAVVTWSKRNNAGATRATRSATTKKCNDEWK